MPGAEGQDSSDRINPTRRRVKSVGLPSASSAEDIVKVDVTLAPGMSKSGTSLDVFRDSAAGALPATWAKLPGVSNVTRVEKISHDILISCDKDMT